MKQLPEQKISNINQYFQKNEIKKKTKIESRKISRYNQEKYQEKIKRKFHFFFGNCNVQNKSISESIIFLILINMRCSGICVCVCLFTSCVYIYIYSVIAIAVRSCLDR